MPRFKCANHALSTVINHALVSQKYLLEIIKTLSSSNAGLRKCIKANAIFRELKCRPITYHKIRWLGAINLLFSNKRAYDNGAYDTLDCPVRKETIEIYIQVLLPAFYITLGWEKNKASIADVIPGVLYLVNVWNKMEIEDARAKELCYFLIHFMRKKFEYELNSNVYKVCFKFKLQWWNKTMRLGLLRKIIYVTRRLIYVILRKFTYNYVTR